MQKHFRTLGLTLLLSACGNPSASPALDGGGSDGGQPDGSAATCTAARAQLLGEIDSVAAGDIKVLATASGVTTLYVDASAGGGPNAGKSAWSYLNLESTAKVELTDKTSVSSTAWDLALKRALIYTNDGDGGLGQGGAVLIQKDFASVTAADAASATFQTEKFFDAQCKPILDRSGAVQTSLTAWYDYNGMTHTVTPAAGTWLVRGGTGKLYKLAIETYYANPDGTVGTGGGGTYALKVGAL